VVQIQVNSGETCLFWVDSWNQQSLEIRFPELCSFAKTKAISVAKAWVQEDFTHLLNLPLSEIAFNQLQALHQERDFFNLNENNDKWKYQWGQHFSSSRAYKFIKGQSHHHQSIQWIWNCFCQPKHKVFFWLLLQDRLSTRNILRRKNMALQSYNFYNHTVVFYVIWVSKEQSITCSFSANLPSNVGSQ